MCLCLNYIFENSRTKYKTEWTEKKFSGQWLDLTIYAGREIQMESVNA